MEPRSPEEAAAIEALEANLTSAINIAVLERPPDLTRRVGEILLSLAADGAGEAGEAGEAGKACGAEGELPAPLRELRETMQRVLDQEKIGASRTNSAAESHLPDALKAFTPLAQEPAFKASAHGVPPRTV